MPCVVRTEVRQASHRIESLNSSAHPSHEEGQSYRSIDPDIDDGWTLTLLPLWLGWHTVAPLPIFLLSWIQRTTPSRPIGPHTSWKGVPTPIDRPSPDKSQAGRSINQCIRDWKCMDWRQGRARLKQMSWHFLKSGRVSKPGRYPSSATEGEVRLRPGS